jgi:beta-lactamase regulating signal transducer with metallopeptidase domain/nucleoid-associated protein YgaU
MSGFVMLMETGSRALGHAVVQSLWQCALVGAVATLIAMSSRRASVRCGVWCAAMAVAFAWFVATLASGIMPAEAAPALPVGAGLALPDAALSAVSPSGVSRGGDLLQFVAGVWVLGFACVGVRFIKQWIAARSLRVRGVRGAEMELETLFSELRRVLRVPDRVGVLVSERALSPMVVGWVTPVVVVPASVVTMLSPEQMRLVLAHELAHIRRFDHLVNMLQVLVESVMFYHPVVWWMSHQVRVEREHCCDDAAVRVCGDAVSYARALTELEAIRVRSRAVLALQGGSLMKRITRLLDGSDAGRVHGAVAAMSVGLLVAGAAYAHSAMAEEPIEASNVYVGVEIPAGVAVGHGEMIEFIRRHAASGALSRDQALELYRGLVEPSYMEVMDLIEADVLAAIEAGRMSEEDGLATISGERSGIAWEIEHRFLMEVYGLSAVEAQLELMKRTLDAEVASGALTREEADARIASMRESLYQRVVEGELVLEGVEIKISEPADFFVGQPIEVVVGEPVEVYEGVPIEVRVGEPVEVRDEARQIDLTVEVLDGTLREDAAPIMVEGVPILRSVPLKVEGRLRREAELQQRVVTDLKLEMAALDSFVERGDLGMDEAKARYDALLLRLREVVAEADPVPAQEPVRGVAIMVMREYEVVAGDTLGSISTELYGDESRVKEIMDLNGIQDPQRIRVGTTLRVPGAAPIQRVEPKKLTPNDEAYWHHQGIRSLDAYDDQLEGC